VSPVFCLVLLSLTAASFNMTGSLMPTTCLAHMQGPFKVGTIRSDMATSLDCTIAVILNVGSRTGQQTVKGEEGCSIEGATVSDYIHNQDE
jgi:hypothetical protein